MKTDRSIENLSEFHCFSPIQSYHCSVLLWVCLCSYSPQGNIYKAVRTHSGAITFLLISTSRVLSSNATFSGSSWDRTDVLRGCGNRLLHVSFQQRKKQQVKGNGKKLLFQIVQEIVNCFYNLKTQLPAKPQLIRLAIVP